MKAVRRLGGAPEVVGRDLSLNGTAHTVIGVLDPDFQFDSPQTQLWAPLGLTGAETRNNRNISVIGRLRPGATVESAGAELSGIASQLQQSFPETNKSQSTRVLTLRDELFDEHFKTASAICTVAVAFVLLIACANVANLLLVRASAREREIAVRTALGAGRRRIAGQLLTESVLLALLGGLAGLIFSVWGIKILVGMMPAWFPFRDNIELSQRTMLYTLVVTLGSGVLFGLAPALEATRPNLTRALRDGSRGSTAGTRRGRLRSTLVVSEIALALVLMISAGLLVKSAVGLQTTPLGFDTENIVTLRVAPREAEYPDSARVIAFYQALLLRLRGVPGLDNVAAARCAPLTCGMATPYSVIGQPEVEPDKRPVAQFRSITPGLLETLRIGVLRGRDFTDRDRLDATRVMLINETLARRHWANVNPVGQHVLFDTGAREIVGVVKDVREWGPDEEAPAVMYFPEYQTAERGMTIIARSGSSLDQLLPVLRAEIRAVDPNLPIFDVRTMTDILRDHLGGDMILTKLLAFFAVAALFLAVLGVYGVMAYSVSQRTQEMGVRMAIGAQRADILRLIVRQGGILAGIGLGIGLLISLAVTRGLSLFLHGVSAFDPAVFVGVSVALALSALAASVFPARRATHVDPLIALRAQ
jgi:putative ABC transport system permease protein